MKIAKQYILINMWFLFIFTLTPPDGEFRTKVENTESNIKAYKLLERNKNTEQNIEDEIPNQQNIKTSFIIQTPPQNAYQPIITIQISSIFSAIKMHKKNKIKIYYNQGKFEYIKLNDQ